MNDYTLEQSIRAVDRFLQFQAGLGLDTDRKRMKLSTYRNQLDSKDPGVEKRFRSFCQRLDIKPFSVSRRVLRKIYNDYHGADWTIISGS